MSILIITNSEMIMRRSAGASHGLEIGGRKRRDLIENAQFVTHKLCSCGDFS